VALNAGSGGYSGSLNGGNAIANSGCGGGGGAVNNDASLRGTGGSGGSGIIVIAYPDTFPSLIVSSGLTYTISTSSRPGHKVYRFLSGSGSIFI
jgi:hypothetical protein